MSQLGDFLEVVYGPREPFSSVRARIRHWRDRGLERQAANRPPIGRPKAFAEPKAKSIEDMRLSVWMNGVQKYRIEEEVTSASRTARTTTIVNGNRQWLINEQGQVETDSSKQEANPNIARHFFAPSLREYFVGLALEPLGSIETLGRNCLRLRAIPRPKGRLWPHWLPSGADEYEFHADPERGVLLYIAGKSNGEIFELNEVTDVAFDETLDPTIFHYTPSAGQSTRPAIPIVERLTLEAAIARAPITVLVPTHLPDDLRRGVEVMYHPRRANSSREHLLLMYRGKQSLWLDESANADSELAADLEWELIENDGRKFEISDPGVADGMTMVAFEQSGTHISMMSNLERDQLIKVATSLAPAK